MPQKDFISKYEGGQYKYEDDENFENTLGNVYIVEESDRQLRSNNVTHQNIHKNCKEMANDILEGADEVDLTNYSCCYCNFGMLTTQWHTCNTCKQHVLGFGIGCMDREGVCKNCQ